MKSQNINRPLAPSLINLLSAIIQLFPLANIEHSSINARKDRNFISYFGSRGKKSIALHLASSQIFSSSLRCGESKRRTFL